MFSGSPLNRLSWLRPSHPFLNAIIVHPKTRWLVFNSGQPLVLANADSLQKQSLAWLTTNDIRPFLGHEPFFGQGKDEGQLVVESPDVQHSTTEAARHRESPVVFLGLQEDSESNALPSSDFVDPEAAIANIEGTPYFSMDVADLDLRPEGVKKILDSTTPARSGQVLRFYSEEGHVFLSVHRGAFTDRLMVALRQKKFPGKFYSALAGFIEPGETFEDAVAREMWEEAGVTVWDVRYHSGQPWPYPANLMVGFYARADSTQPIRVDLDNELLDARWYTRAEIQAVLGHPIGGKFGSAEYKKMAESTEGRNNQAGPAETAPHPNSPNEVKVDEPPFRLPPVTAIAGVLIRDWVEGKIRFSDQVSKSVIHKGFL
ncbi:hypothetical protein DXG03_006235 [Asterophora parasitica]|uniref:NAD(+) diphosphatase n=1 Tax=Asterophora parasitica TaxID=117018 RepID=A0A9P7G8W6_9AGAR|nr:hypothetical protein DXG03_006235 [Asterophora parasitica]